MHTCMAGRGGCCPAALVGLLFLLLVASDGVSRAGTAANRTSTYATLRPRQELRKLKRVKAYLRRINKPPIKTFQTPEGDTIDCVLSHLQPAFDHPLLKGQKPLDAPDKRPLQPGRNSSRSSPTMGTGQWQYSCPEGSVPIRRTTEEDVLRASSRSVKRYGRKPAAAAPRSVRRDSSTPGHEHAVGYVMGGDLYGAKASINVWAPKVATQSEFSLSQIWVISGSFAKDLNTIEAGWQVSPELYGDSKPRFFTYWTTDAYQATGCYNMLCSGFVQTSNRIAIGAAISPVSSYKSAQFDITVLLWKDPKHGNWWLELGPGHLVGYWPAALFSHLREHASMVQFGGEIVDSQPSGQHTATQMGSGHLPGEGFGRASYFRNLQVVDWDNSLVPAAAASTTGGGLRFLADHPSCYDVKAGTNHVWGDYFYYGGPGRSHKCS